MTLDAERLPAELRPLLPTAERWGFSDDLQRSMAIEAAPRPTSESATYRSSVTGSIGSGVSLLNHSRRRAAPAGIRTTLRAVDSAGHADGGDGAGVPTLPMTPSNQEVAMARGKNVATEFKDFILRGNVVDLAIAVVIGMAFGAVVNAFVKDLLTPLVAAVFGKPNFGNLKFTINNSQFLFGDVINQIITFLSVATAVFFFVVKPVNMLTERRKKAPEPESDNRPCPECLSEIPKAATRCSFCTVAVAPIAPLG
jgi:large conductance mechanosensitive channel